MKHKQNILYIVEGQTELKLLETLKTELRYILAGKIIKHNVVQDIVKQNKFLSICQKTLFVLIFDTDTDGVKILKENIKIISKLPNSSGVITIPQIKNLEEELCYSCNIKNIRELTKSKTFSDVKRDFLNITNLGVRLKEAGFKMSLLWARFPSGDFAEIENYSSKIKIS